MTKEEYLKEQIESYIDQLDLLKMQEQFEQEKYDKVVDECVRLIEQYNELIKEKVENDIQVIESLSVVSIEEALNKRTDILLVVSGHETLLEDLLIDSSHAPELRERTKALFDVVKKQVSEYQSDVDLVKEQLKNISEANEREKELKEEKTKLLLEYSVLKNYQVSYQDLGVDISAQYNEFIKENNIEKLDLQVIQAQRIAYLERQKQLEENLSLAKKAKGAEGYEKTYEKKIRDNKLQIDKFDEQIFLCLISKIMMYPIDSYDSLAKRTTTIELLMAKRINTVEALYREGIIKKDEYGTSASKINHHRIKKQLEDLKQMDKIKSQISEIDKELEHLRDNIKGKRDLEEYFEQRAKDAGRTPGKPELTLPVEKLEVELQSSIELPKEDCPVLNDEESYDGYQMLNPKEVRKDKKNRRKVIDIEKAKPNLLSCLLSDKLKKILSRFFSRKSVVLNLNEVEFKTTETDVELDVASENNREEVISDLSTELSEDIERVYSPSIGDKIHLTDGSKIYINPSNAVNGENAYDTVANGLINDDLFVTRGAIFDQNGTIIYITTEHGVDLNSVLHSKGLEEKAYGIALGCSLGDENGNFIQVSDNKLNPNIEKGWINANEKNMMIIEQLSDTLEKGGMSK